MGPEGIQFLAITHPHYVERMNGREVPFLNLPDYAISPNGDGDFSDAPRLRFGGKVGKLRLRSDPVGRRRSKYGSASLR
jgi:hypothetical protein